ncbi:hypothetical protein F2Q70_00015571 [Brassica cretica]|uniref:Uncharacterized protein n=1 Tax=Brassica cretica TaxID=69181 RepID=A0A8S9HX42_BRACR|nr:hypothetical protein F2Q70_00015571 [Brassica cretica]
MEEDFVRRFPGSLEVVWKTSWKSSGRLPGSRLEDFQEVVWKTSWKSSGRLPGSRLVDFLEVVWKTSWKSSGRLPGSRLEDSGRLPGSRLALYFRRLTGKSSHKSSRSEKPVYQIQI